MKFYHDKLVFLRKSKGYSSKYFCKNMNISRSTLWAWESGKRIPKREDIYAMASELNISVNSISDLSPIKFTNSNKDETASLNGHQENLGLYAPEYYDSADKAINHINLMINTFKDSTIIINALLKTLPCLFYIKNINLKYVVANSAFLSTLSLPTSYMIRNKNDNDLFPHKEAQINSEQDKLVFLSGKSILKEEGYIPGTRKKKWGINSKLPIFDSNNNIIGLIGLFVDITERKKEEKKSKILEAGINFITDSLTIVNETTLKYIYMNNMRKKIFGYPDECFLENGCNFWLYNCVHPDNRDIEEKYLYKKIQCPVKRNYKILLPDGRTRLIEARTSTKSILDSKSEYIVVIERDMGIIT
jgi:PAS domain-containing protein